MALAPLEERFGMLVQMVQRDMEKMKQAIIAQNLEIAGLKAQVAQLGGKATPQATIDGEIVGQHPITGAPVTRADLEKDPKLKMRMMFSENDA